MSSFWSLFIIVLTVVSILATLFLLKKTSSITKEELDTETTGHVWDGDLRELNNPLPRWWLNLFYITIVFAIAYLVLYPGLGNFAGTLGWTSTGQYDTEVAAAEAEYQPIFAAFAERPIAELAGDSAALSAGYNLFVNECAQCHGADARGARGFPNLSDSAWLWGGDTAQIVATITNGRQGVMPPWGAALGEDGVREAAQYVRQLGGLDHDAALASAGATRFQTFCSACHGLEGKGNPLLGAPDLTDADWLYGSDLESITETIQQGRQNQMPAFKDRLGDERIHVVAAYVYSLSAQQQ